MLQIDAKLQWHVESLVRLVSILDSSLIPLVGALHKMQVQSLRLVLTIGTVFVKLVENFVAQVEPVLNFDPSLADQEKPLPIDRYRGPFLNFELQGLDVVDRK